MADEEYQPDEYPADLPETVPRTFAGQPVSAARQEGVGPIERGFWATSGGFFGVGLSRAGTEWAALLEGGSVGARPNTSFARHKEIVGERGIKFRLDASESEIKRQVYMYDQDEYQTQYESRPIAQFVGTMAGELPAPVNALTAFVGGPNLVRAAVAKTLGTFLKQSYIGSGKIALASIPVDAAVQEAATGEVDAGQVLMNAAGVFALGPVLAVPGKILNKMTGGRTDVDVNDVVRLSDDFDSNPVAAARALQDDPNIPAPPDPGTVELPAVARRTLEKGFEEYEGGVRQWFRDLAAQSPRAAAQAEKLGIDPENAAVQKALREIGDASDVQSKTPTDYNVQLIDDIKTPTPEGNARLQQNGILNTKGKPAPLFKNLVDVAKKPEGELTVAERATLYDFVDEGPAPSRLKAKEVAGKEVKRLEKQLVEDEVALAKAKVDTPTHRKRNNRARQSRRQLAQARRESTANVSGPRVIDDSIPDNRLFEVLTHARAERARTNPPAAKGNSPEDIASQEEYLAGRPSEVADSEDAVVEFALRTLQEKSGNAEGAAARIEDIHAMLKDLDGRFRSCKT